MEDWDLTSIGLVLIGSSITAAGTLIAAFLLEITITISPISPDYHNLVDRY